MSGHTPGPWVVSDPWMGFSQLIGRDGAFIFGLAAGAPSEKQPDDVCEANARLISAAPTMLEALRRAEQFITNGIELGFIRMPDASTRDTASETPGIIKAAILKATGSTP